MAGVCRFWFAMCANEADGGTNVPRHILFCEKAAHLPQKIKEKARNNHLDTM